MPHGPPPSAPGEAFEHAMEKAVFLDMHYNENMKAPGITNLKNKADVTNLHFGRGLNTMKVDAPEEPVSRPEDMTRQIPRYNCGTQMGYNDPMKVASIQQHNQHVPRRAPTVIHGVNSLKNSQANVIRGEAEFFGTQQGVKALKDTLNYDPLDKINKDMMRVNKTQAVDEITAKAGLHNTEVRRSRTRKRVGQIYV